MRDYFPKSNVMEKRGGGATAVPFWIALGVACAMLLWFGGSMHDRDTLLAYAPANAAVYAHTNDRDVIAEALRAIVGDAHDLSPNELAVFALRGTDGTLRWSVALAWPDGADRPVLGAAAEKLGCGFLYLTNVCVGDGVAIVDNASLHANTDVRAALAAARRTFPFQAYVADIGSFTALGGTQSADAVERVIIGGRIGADGAFAVARSIAHIDPISRLLGMKVDTNSHGALSSLRALADADATVVAAHANPERLREAYFKERDSALLPSSIAALLATEKDSLPASAFSFRRHDSTVTALLHVAPSTQETLATAVSRAYNANVPIAAPLQLPDRDSITEYRVDRNRLDWSDWTRHNDDSASLIDTDGTSVGSVTATDTSALYTTSPELFHRNTELSAIYPHTVNCDISRYSLLVALNNPQGSSTNPQLINTFLTFTHSSRFLIGVTANEEIQICGLKE